MEKLTALLIVGPLLLVLNFVQSIQGESNGFRGKEYISRDPGQCQTLRYLCAPGYTPFFDEKGCGCEREKNTENKTICTEEFAPVCGLQKRECITTPCSSEWKTYPNRCYAERDGATEIKSGECP
jgi:hypothetical protein